MGSIRNNLPFEVVWSQSYSAYWILLFLEQGDRSRVIQADIRACGGILTRNTLWFGSYRCTVSAESFRYGIVQGFPAHCHVRYRYGIVQGFQPMAVLEPSDFKLSTEEITLYIAEWICRPSLIMNSLLPIYIKQLITGTELHRWSEFPDIGDLYISFRVRSKNATPHMSFFQCDDSGYRFHKSVVNIQAGKLASRSQWPLWYCASCRSSQHTNATNLEV